MAFKKQNYPPYWKQFSEYIRFERANNLCERCGIKNGFYKATYKVGFSGVKEFYGESMDGILFTDEKPIRVTKIVLTVAHLDRANDICQCKRFYGFKCAKPSHVLALCQSCHLAYDRDLHIAVRRKNLAQKKDSERSLFQTI